MIRLKRFILIASAVVVSLLAHPAHWTCDPHNYQYDMTAYVQLQDGGRVIADIWRYELAALVGDECRGVSQWVTTADGRNYGLVRLWSNVEQGETLHWRVFDVLNARTQAVYGTQTELPFVAQSVVSLPSAPIIFDLQERKRGDATGDGRVDIADLNAVINTMLGKVTSDELQAASDVTGDGLVDISDVNAIINIMLGK